MREVGPQSGEQTKKTLNSKKASFVPPKKKELTPVPLIKRQIFLKSKEGKFTKNNFFCLSISFAPSIYVTKNPAPPV